MNSNADAAGKQLAVSMAADDSCNVPVCHLYMASDAHGHPLTEGKEISGV